MASRLCPRTYQRLTMTTGTTRSQTPAASTRHSGAGAAASEPEVGCFYIPLDEFGPSLAGPNLDEWLEAFAARNKHTSGGFFEVTANGELMITPPTGIPGYWFETEFVIDLGVWNRDCGGKVGGPTGRFRMPDGSRLGSEAPGLSPERWNAATEEQRRPPFASIAPDFICAIVSPSNRGPELVSKVALFIANGARLTWVINPQRRLVTIYRPSWEPETLVDPGTLDSEDAMPGFIFAVGTRISNQVG